ncbi:TonB-dependent receptor [Sphingobium subterraneum]|uniref:Outer membrane receptor protein involved in Fe transport n=1 Tax=Sphingobium subterraneum TaxID=627688 RepID=A0A841J395_9SPHN|nr:TonB-dependent receptor [Sphingobium subterraneum]MBB6125244.1 outer membrane receptor protein involved in Fe transport [Sphingobium subterraneum]
MKASIYLMGISYLALAAPSASAQAQAATAEGEEKIADIVVTAQKRSERLQDVPIAVSVATSEQIQNSGVKEVMELQTIVPGLNVTVANGSLQLSLRGIATSSNVVENPVSLYIDGVYLPLQQEGVRDLADVEQVTVLKGPQGTLFGRNATAGVIQMTTRGPDFSTQGQFNISYGSYQTINTNAYVSTGLSDNVAVSLSGAYKTQGKGWGKSLVTGKEENKLDHAYSSRGKLLFKMGDDSSLLIVGDYLNREDNGATFAPYPGLPKTTIAYQGIGPSSNRFDSYSGTAGRTAFKGGGVAATFKHDFGFAELVSISAYRKFDFAFRYDLDGSPAQIVDADATGRGRMYSQELQLVSDGKGPLKWVTGVYYFNYRQGYDYFNRDISAGQRLNGGVYRFAPLSRNATLNTFEKSESIAPFAQADLEVTPGTTVTAGLRYTYEKRSLDGFSQTTSIAGVPNALNHFTPAPLVAKKVTWRFAANQKLSQDVMLFASYSRGFKSGGFNISTPAAINYLPESLDDWEIGLKSQFWDRRITFNATGFYYKYKNVQVSQFNGNPPSQRITNGAGAELYGVDIDLTAKVVDGLTLTGGLSLIHSEFTDYPNAPLNIDLATPNPANGNTIAVGILPNAKGNRLPYARKYGLTGAVDYRTQLMGGNFGFNLTATRNGDYYFEPDNTTRQPRFTMLNASVRLSDASDNVSLRFGVANLLNRVIYSRNVTLVYGRLVSYGVAPREYTLTLGAKF